MPLVLRFFKLVSQLLIESFLLLDLCFKLSDLSTKIVNPIKRWQKRLFIIRIPDCQGVVSLATPSGGDPITLQIRQILPHCPAVIIP